MSNCAQKTESDEELLEDIARGNQDALTRLYDLYSPAVMAVAYHILKQKQEAEDLVHDVFIEAWQKSKSYDPKKGSVRNWLMLRTRCRSIDRLRKLARMETRSNIEASDLSASMIDSLVDSNIDPMQQLDHRQAHQAISKLSPDHALLIKASYFEDLTYREIAEKYQIPEGTVKSRMLAAFKVLRKHLISNGGGDIWIRT